MIQPLRSVHRGIFTALAVLLPAVFVGGLAARRAQPVQSAPPLQEQGAAAGIEAGGGWRTVRMTMKIFPGEASQSGARMTLRPPEDFAEPEVLLYWSGVEPQSASLPGGARLLGKLDPAAVYLLPPAAATGGFLILYSAGRDVLLDWTPTGGGS